MIFFVKTCIFGQVNVTAVQYSETMHGLPSNNSSYFQSNAVRGNRTG